MKAKTMNTVLVSEFPQLTTLCWQFAPDARLTWDEALSVYERNWRYVEQEKLTADEAAFIQELVDTCGNGVFLV
ncbi:hypothetical protein nbrc107696_30960 [Gordonia spumicola]|uniref:Uncharacterized protein n=1 Tax=Gordonia spumicola TaxID=589161 RepID=A0A7I9VCB5_9ACTN|nr:hypothetical protein [Gordonia spumicola]GEE02650.1 hypothetical protein nbrc107696_30960 [Gordonia spumicola]